MPPFSAHLGYLFTELPFAERFAAAHAAGFGAVEHPDPYTFGVVEFAHVAREEGLEVAQIAAPSGDAAKGEKGLACLPGREVEFCDSVQKGIEAALAIGCQRVHVMPGVLPKGTTREALRPFYVSNLAWASEAIAVSGLTPMIEAISDQTVPGFYISDPAFAVDLIGEIANPALRLLLDTYHAAMNGHDAVAFLDANLDLIGHVHVADHPGRAEPGTGRIDFASIWRLLDQRGFEGWVGCEYKPTGDTAQGLRWMPRSQT